MTVPPLDELSFLSMNYVMELAKGRGVKLTKTDAPFRTLYVCNTMLVVSHKYHQRVRHTVT